MIGYLFYFSGCGRIVVGKEKEVQVENMEEASKSIEGAAESLGNRRGKNVGKKERKKWSRQKGCRNNNLTNKVRAKDN